MIPFFIGCLMYYYDYRIDPFLRDCEPVQPGGAHRGLFSAQHPRQGDRSLTNASINVAGFCSL